MKREEFELGETAVTIVADEEYIPSGKEAIFRAREIIQGFITRDPFFQLTLEAYNAPEDAAPLIKRMCEASRLAQVGPMASVAGAIAEEAVGSMVKAGAEHAIVDNGGDIALYLSEETVVGLYAGGHWSNMGLRCAPRKEIFGICTSSGTIGPSISFGIADAATVISSNVTLADACATMLGNMIKSKEESIIGSALERTRSVPGIEGALVIAENKIAMSGRLPPLVKTAFDGERISRLKLGKK